MHITELILLLNVQKEKVSLHLGSVKKAGVLDARLWD
jgi:hypothetical protein